MASKQRHAARCGLSHSVSRRSVPRLRTDVARGKSTFLFFDSHFYVVGVQRLRRVGLAASEHDGDRRSTQRHRSLLRRPATAVVDERRVRQFTRHSDVTQSISCGAGGSSSNNTEWIQRQLQLRHRHVYNTNTYTFGFWLQRCQLNSCFRSLISEIG